VLPDNLRLPKFEHPTIFIRALAGLHRVYKFHLLDPTRGKIRNCKSGCSDESVISALLVVENLDLDLGVVVVVAEILEKHFEPMPTDVAADSEFAGVDLRPATVLLISAEPEKWF
jgi:hypothetical protein